MIKYLKEVISNSNNQSGQIFVLAVIILALVLINTVVLLSSSLTYSQSAKYSTEELQAINLAEAGIDKAVASFNADPGGYTGDINEIELDNGSFTVTINSIDSDTNLIEATGYIPNKLEARVKRTISVQMSKGTGVNFGYGVQLGEGGLHIKGGSSILGSVYSNNNVVLEGGSFITGDVYVAGGTSPIADQNNNTCSGVNCQDYDFGKTVASEKRFDISQGFTIGSATNTPINKVRLQLKKKGTISQSSHSDLPLRIVSDNAGKPSKTVLASGTISASQVTSEYGWIEVSLSPNPNLNTNTQYWIVVDTCANSTNCDNAASYWSWKRDSLGGYAGTNNKPGFSQHWTPNNQPVWTFNVTGDLIFETYMGGVSTKIQGIGSSAINGTARANTLMADNSSALRISQSAYYQTIEANVRVHSSACNVNNTYCHPNSTDPEPRSLPISEANINEWKATATGNGVLEATTFQWPCTAVLENKEYNGNVTVQGGCTIQAESPVYIKGNLNLTGGAKIRLKNSYGAQSGIIVVDGKITLNGGSEILGSGDASSYMLVLSTYASANDTDTAITASGGNSSSILYASNGVILLNGGARLREVTAKKLIVDGGGQVIYETGVENPNFSAGPTGSYNVIKGTYQLK